MKLCVRSHVAYTSVCLSCRDEIGA